jgi:hypothetical protein
MPDSYAETLEHFAYLRPDYICLYDDLGVGGGMLPEEISGVFAHTGYWPALPLVLREKGMAWRFGNVRLGYVPRDRGGLPPPSWIRRVGGTVLEHAGAGLARIDAALAPAPSTRPPTNDPTLYVTQMLHAIDVALVHARGVVVVVSPAETAAQSANLAALRPLVNHRLAATPALRFVDLGGVPELTAFSQRIDGWNYGGDAIAVAASVITPALLELIAR